MISKSIFKIMVMAERGRGTKLDKIIPRPEILLTEAWLGKEVHSSGYDGHSCCKDQSFFDQFCNMVV